MKRLLAVASIILASEAVGFGQRSVEQTLIDLEQQWVKAARAGNGSAVALLLGDRFRGH